MNNIDKTVYLLNFFLLSFIIFFHLLFWMGALGFEPRSAGLFLGHRSSYSSPVQMTLFQSFLTGAHNDAGLHHAPGLVIIFFYFLLLLFSRLIRFLRHFQRILCLFFHTRELRFILENPLFL